MPLKIKPNLQSVANLEELISRIRFMSLGNHGIFHLVKYCFILQKKCKLPNAAENVDKTGYHGLTLVIVCGNLNRIIFFIRNFLQLV